MGEKMNAKDLKKLESLNPCADGLAWGKTQNSLHDVYENCERGDWMIWILIRSKKLTKTQATEIAITCAKHVYHDPDWNRWADAWLDGSDRTKASAASAANAASAAWVPSAASAAERAAYWAASASSAARAARAAASAASAANAASAASAEYWAASAAYWAYWAARAEIKWQADRIREIVENPWGKK
jgi:hypothetical protein